MSVCRDGTSTPTFMTEFADPRRDVALAPLTTIRVGGSADWFAPVASFRAVSGALAWAEARHIPVAVIGRGSNLIVSDAGFRGLVITLTGRLRAISVRRSELWCGGGASLPRAVQRAGAAGLGGLEFGASIPGTVGGAVAMNAGAYRSELSDVLAWAVVCTADGRRRVDPEELAFGYRRSAIGGREVVAAAGFRLRPMAPEPITEQLSEFRRHRRATQPQGVRTFGSVFMNPEGDSAGRLLDEAGCRGLRLGGARFSPVHANFIEARAGSSSTEVIALIREGRRRVRERGGPTLESEVRYLHEHHGIVRPPIGDET